MPRSEYLANEAIAMTAKRSARKHAAVQPQGGALVLVLKILAAVAIGASFVGLLLSAV